ncbi:hypothetical protein QTP70_022197, partial [Hemibagrus guttatus]
MSRCTGSSRAVRTEAAKRPRLTFSAKRWNPHHSLYARAELEHILEDRDTEPSTRYPGAAEGLSNVLEIVGGAELGEFPYLGHGSPPLSVALRWHAGRAPSPGDVLLEVNGTPVSGLTHRDTLAVIRHFREPVRLKTVKPG